MIDITGIDKAELLAALYNASKPLGMGFWYFDARPMEAPEARRILGGCHHHFYFYYLKGRVMKVDLSSDSELEEYLYDRANGVGAAARVVNALRAMASDVPAEESK